MKTIFRFLSVGMLLSAFIAVGATTGFAQDVCENTAEQDTLQDKIRETYASKVPEAIDAGKQLLEKYGSCDYSADFVAWLKPLLPKWEESEKNRKVAEERSAILKRYDAAVSGKNWDEAYAAGNEFISKFPNDPAKINIIIPLGLVGLYESAPPAQNYKYNDQTIRFAKMAISELKGGVKATKKNAQGQDAYGAFQFEATKDDAISELTYGLGYIYYWAKGDKKTALPYYYEALQSPGRNKDNPFGYATIGEFYRDEVVRLSKQYADLVATRNAEDSPEVAAEKEENIKKTVGMLKGYLDRSIDAFARAYKSTKADAASKESRDGLYKTLQDLYELRFEKTEGFDAYISSTVTKPMPNPTSEVQPVLDAEPATTTTGSSTAAATKP